MNGNKCDKFNKEIKLIEIEYLFKNKTYFLPSAIQCAECIKEKGR